MNLVNSSQSVTVAMGGAKTTTESNVIVEYQDIVLSTGLASVLPGPAIGNRAVVTAGATAVTALAAGALLAATGTTLTVPRQITFMAIYNADTVSQTYTISFLNLGSTYTMAVVTLLAGEQMTWTPQTGFRTFTAAGVPKGASGIGGNALRSVLNVTGTQLLASLVNANTYRIAVPFAFTVISARTVADVAASTSSKLATLTLSTTAGAVTGGVMALTTLNMTPTGAAVSATAISGANAIGTAGQEVILTVSSVTAFVEGAAHVEVVVQNNDLAR